MSTPPLALCPSCGTLIPIVPQLGGPDALYCRDDAHWADAGYDVQALRDEFKRWLIDTHLLPLAERIAELPPFTPNPQEPDPDEREFQAFVARVQAWYRDKEERASDMRLHGD